MAESTRIIVTISMVHPDGSTTSTIHGPIGEAQKHLIEAFVGPAILETYFDADGTKAAIEAGKPVVVAREAP